MKIGIDISQTTFGTGVGNYVAKLVSQLLLIDKDNDYILFFSSLRRKLDYSFINELTSSRVSIRQFRFPPTLLDFLWNKLHILSIESLIGDVDVFISSDWTQPPTRKAKSVTILYDLIVYKYPEETARKIVQTQKRRLNWVKRECDEIICISDATKRDAMEILHIEESRLRVVYPGI